MAHQFTVNTNQYNPDHQTNDRSLWDRTWRHKEGHIVIFQFPNAWLIAWLVLEVVSLLAASHGIEIVSWWLATAALAVWSLLELFQGVNYFRRLLGLIVAVLTLLSIFGVGL